MKGTLFRYTDFSVSDNNTEVSFRFGIGTNDKSFDIQETIQLPFSLNMSPEIQRTLRALHIALGISYYKSFVPPEIQHPYNMDADEARFWNTAFRKGLGEFLYDNRLSSKQLAQFKTQDGLSVDASGETALNPTAVLGIGGGKDSIVAGELLRSIDTPTSGYVLATKTNEGQTRAVADAMGIELDSVQRTIDRQILGINALPGAYNGHVPISLIFALVGCLVALQRGSQYVIVANEASSSIPHVVHEGSAVNHQWSKSLEFEKLFQQFVHTTISERLQYTSAIRPLTSVAVAKIFSQFPNYFEVFTSDNSLFKIDQSERKHPRWSTDSPKSLSSFILLAPWMSDDDLMQTFGRNFLDQPELETLFLDLIGASEHTILDCVGTPDELRLSMTLLHEHGRFADSHLMKTAMSENMLVEGAQAKLAEHCKPSTVHALPSDLAETLLSKMGELL